MSVLENPRHERFAQELAKGKSATEAMAAAGYSDPRNSTRMTKNDEIRCRVAELQSRAAERAVVTIESLILEVEEARKLAMRTEQPSAAISAIREKGIISGKRIERSENAKPGEFDAMFEAIKAMTPEQRRARAAELVKQLVAAGVCDGEGRAKD